MKSLLRSIFLCASLINLSSCSGADILNATVTKKGYEVREDIAYGDNPRQKLDIYIPEEIRPTKDVIIFFYGGSWQSGSKDDYLFTGQAFASKGYITVIADYRLYPEVKFPTFMEDSAHAFKWVHHNIAHYGGDAKRLFLAGHSAGAYNAVMLAVNDEYFKNAGVKKEWVKGVIGLAGPYDFLPFTDPAIIDIFSTKQDALTQPIHHVTSGLPPMLLLAGTADKEVYPKNTHNMATKLRESGNIVTEITYPGVAHIGIILALARGFRGKAPVLEDIDKFISGI